METVAVGVYVTQATGKAGWTGTVAALTYAPSVLVGPIGGAVADRFDRRRYLATIALLQTVLAASLAVLAASHHLSVAAVALIVLLEGTAVAFYMPASSAMTPDLVPHEDLLGAMSLGQAQWNLGRVIGPALAGLVITAWGLSAAFWVNAASFGAVLLSLALITVPPLPRRDGSLTRVWHTIAEGVTASRRDPGIRTALLLLLATTFLVSPFIGLVPAVAIKVFHRGASGTSVLVTAQGIGAVIAALTAGPLAARFGRGRLLLAALLLVGPAAAAYGLAPRFPLAVAGILLLGFCYLLVLSGTSTVCQLRAPRTLRARVASLFMLCIAGGHSLGLLTQGWLADRLGLPTVTATTALLLLAIVAATRLLRPPLFTAMATDLPGERPPFHANPAQPAAPGSQEDRHAPSQGRGSVEGGA